MNTTQPQRFLNFFLIFRHFTVLYHQKISRLLNTITIYILQWKAKLRCEKDQAQ